MPQPAVQRSTIQIRNDGAPSHAGGRSLRGDLVGLRAALRGRAREPRLDVLPFLRFGCLSFIFLCVFILFLMFFSLPSYLALSSLLSSSLLCLAASFPPSSFFFFCSSFPVRRAIRIIGRVWPPRAGATLGAFATSDYDRDRLALVRVSAPVRGVSRSRCVRLYMPSFSLASIRCLTRGPQIARDDTGDYPREHVLVVTPWWIPLARAPGSPHPAARAAVRARAADRPGRLAAESPRRQGRGGP